MRKLCFSDFEKKNQFICISITSKIIGGNYTGGIAGNNGGSCSRVAEVYGVSTNGKYHGAADKSKRLS